MATRRRKGTRDPQQTRGERHWKPPERSDQRDGEHVVQVNDAYTGGQPLDEVPSQKDDQHPTGG
jgi:hypothetical protein